jgi:radical SAM protein with 4Fe4S-binding SPASM domain
MKNGGPQSPGFCIIPWIHMHLGADGSVFSCIEATSSGNPFGNIHQNSFLEIFNSDRIKELRLDMLAGNLPLQCKKCHMQESFGKISRRLQNNNDFKDDLKLLETMEKDGTLPELKMRYMDFRFSNICNLRCKMCMPQNSSSLFEDFEQIYGPQTLPKNIRLISDHPELFKLTLDQLQNVQIIYFAGSEPLLMEEHYQMLKELIRIGRNTEVHLAYNTNFTKLALGKHDVISLWQKFPKLSLYISLDGQGEQLSYLRKGAEWDEILKNREIVREKVPHAKFTVTPVLSAMNCLEMVKLYKTLVSKHFIEPENFQLYFLYEPTFFSVHILPDEIKQKAILEYEKLLKALRNILPENSATINSFSSAVNLLKAQDSTNLIPEFQKHIRLFDQAQETNFLEAFPELKHIY